MTRAGLTILTLTISTSVFAQTGGAIVPVPGSGQAAGVQPGTAPAPDPKLVSHLQAWEARMKAIGNVRCECDKVRTDNVLKRVVEKQVGTVMCLKPNYAFMRLDRAPDLPPDPNDFMTWICDGKAIYQYSGRQKECAEFKLNAQGGIQGNLLLEFISGSMTANDALKRFDVKLLKEDTNYVYLEIRPRLVTDKEDFEVMTLVFYGPNIGPMHQAFRYLPAVVKMTKNQNKEEVWTFRSPQVNAAGMTPKMFEKQPLPPGQGWRSVMGGGVTATTPVTPKVARPQAP
jgi:TIGR03009 family protein